MIEEEGQEEQETAELDDTQEIETDQEATEEPEGEYKIGDQSFATSDEAFAYANSLVHQNAISEAQSNAYRQAVADTGRAQAQSEIVTPEEDDDFDQKFYEDPKKFMGEFAAKIKAETRAEVLGTVTQQSEDEKLWGDFFSKHPDLRDFKEDCEVTLARHTPDVKAIADSRGQKAAMDFLAQKTRAKFQAYAQNSKPARALPRTSSGPSVGGGENVTHQNAPEAKLDFAAELRNLRGKRA